MVYSDDRDGSYLAGASCLTTLGFGLMALAIVGLAASIKGWDVSAIQYFFVFLLGFSTPAVLYGRAIFAQVMTKIRVDISERQASIAPAPDDADYDDAPPPLEVIRQVGGIANGRPRSFAMTEARPARWIKWQAFGRLLHDWLPITEGAIHGAALVGDACMFGRDAGKWKIGTDGLAHAGLAVKVNGITTRLDCSPADLLQRIESGRIEWPEDYDPPRCYPPTPSMVVENTSPTGESIA